jgi:hypothetical protein
VGVLFGPNSDLVDSVMDSVDRWRDAIRGLECASLPGLVLIVILGFKLYLRRPKSCVFGPRRNSNPTVKMI